MRAEAAALAGVVAALAVGLRSPPVVIGCGVLAAAAGAPRWRGRPLTGWATLGLRYAARRRSYRIPAPTGAAASTGHRRSSRRELLEPIDRLRLGVLPGAAALAVTDRAGRPFGLLAWRGRLCAVLAVEAPAEAIVDLAGPADTPLAALGEIAGRSELGLHSIQVLTQIRPIHGVNAAAGAGSGMADVFGAQPPVARRRSFIVIRLELAEASEPIVARGGGLIGASRLMSAAVQRVRAALEAAGIEARALDATESVGAQLDVAGLAEPAGGVVAERWDYCRLPSGYSRARIVTGWPDPPRPGVLDALVAPLASTVTTSVVLRSTNAGTVAGTVCTTVRVSASSRAAAAGASAQLARAALHMGLRTRPLGGTQLAALRATMPIGGG